MAGTGLGLAAVVVGRLLLLRTVALDPVVETSVGFVLAAVLVGAAVWLDRSPLDDDHVWRIAQWSGVGIGLLVLAGVVTLTASRFEPSLSGHSGNLLLTNVAAGGIAGVTFGTIRELGRENDRVRRLNERNRVLGRVLRHNVRNEVTKVIGYAEILAAEHPEPPRELRRIRAAAHAVAETSRKARRIERELQLEESVAAVDVVPIVEREVERAREDGHDVVLSRPIPAAAPVRAGGQLASVVENLVENAAAHGGDDPTIEVGLRVDDAAGVTAITVADDGPGIPDDEVAALADGVESPLEHGSGLGLWLVKWLIERYDGEMRFNETEPDGSIVIVELETA